MKTETVQPPPATLKVAGYVLTLTLLAFALRLYRLGTVEFWFDEAASFYVAARDYGDIITYVRNAVTEHPPFYFLTLHTWMRAVGASEFAMRFLSLWFAVLFVPLMYRFARREFGAPVGLGAALIAAASPFMFVYAQEARMYTLLPLLSLLTMEAALAVVRRDRARDWLALALLLALGIGTHYYFALWIPALSLFLAVRWRTVRRRVLWRWVLLVLVLALPLAFWVINAPGLKGNLSEVIRGYKLTPWYESLERIVQDAVWGEVYNERPATWLRLVALLTWLPVLAALRAVLRNTRAAASEATVLCLALVLCGVGWVAVTSQGIVGRHVAAMVPAFLLLLAVGLAWLVRAGGARAVLAACGVMISFVLGLGSQLLVDKGDLGRAFAQLDRAAQPGDAVIIAQPTMWPLIVYYLQRPDVTVYYLPDHSNGGRITPEEYAPQITRFVEETAKRHGRVWLGPTGALTSDPQQIMPKWLAAQRFATQVDYHRSVSFNLFVQSHSELNARVMETAFGGHIRLLSASVGGAQVRPGETLPLLLQWQTDMRLSSDHLIVFKLVDDQGTLWAENRILPCGGYCQTSDWLAQEAVQDRQAFSIPAGTPPGNYRLMLELFDLAARAPVPIQPGRTSLSLARVNVRPDPAAAVPAMANIVSARFGSNLRLVGFGGVAPEVREGSGWVVELLWRAEQAPAEDLIAVFKWLNSNGEPVAASEFPIGTPDYPTSLWKAGELIRQRVSVPLPAGAQPELQIALQVRVRDSGLVPPLSTAERAAALSTDPAGDPGWLRSALPHLVLASVRVRQIERSFVLPEMTTPQSGVVFGEQFQLAGFSVTRAPRDALDVALAWRALGAAGGNHKVFVHLIADDERVIAQHDGEPAYGFRPTGGWAKGEYLRDEHRISLRGVPPGTYRLEVGLYHPASGARLPLVVRGQPQSADRLILTTLRVP